MYRILITDENVEERSVLFDVFQNFDEEFEIYEAKSKEEAFSVVQNKKIQIAIIDFQIAPQELQENYPHLEIIVIGERGKKSSVDNVRYVEKPIDKIYLEIVITEAIHHISRRSEIVLRDSEKSDNERTNEVITSIEKGENILKEFATIISLKNGTLLIKRLEEVLSLYRKMGVQYPFYVRSMSMSILHLFIKTVPSKMSDIEKMTEFMFRSEEYTTVEHLLRSYAEYVVEEFENETNSSNRVIYQVKQYINLHYHEDLKLNHLAEQVYLSSNYLSNIFTKHTGYSLNKYIKEVRLEKAQELLLGTNMKIADIGRRVGYDNTSYFIKKFQERFGMTPEKYRLNPVE